MEVVCYWQPQTKMNDVNHFYFDRNTILDSLIKMIFFTDKNSTNIGLINPRTILLQEYY